MKIQYENLTIRQAELMDVKQLVSWWNDGVVMAHAGFPNGLVRPRKKLKKDLEVVCLLSKKVTV